MGFGYLLIGYFVAFAFSLANVYFFFDIIGGAVMLVGLSKLSLHGKNFYRAMLSDILYILLCLARTALAMLGVIRREGVLFYIFGIAIALASLLLQFFILAAIYFIAEKVELDEEMNKARRNIKCIILYHLAYVAAVVLVPYLGVIGNFVSLAVTLLGFVVLFFNLALIHSCYCRICLKGQESGERPKSRFAWLNAFYEKTDALFDKAYLRPKTEKKVQTDEESEPAYLRVKRKKKSKRK